MFDSIQNNDFLDKEKLEEVVEMGKNI